MAVKSGSEKAARLRSKIASLRYGRGSQSAKIIAVTGAHGKSTVVKLIAEVLREGGLKVVEMVAASDAEHSFETDPFLLHRRVVDASRLGYPLARLIELIQWLLAKTRKDVLLDIEAGRTPDEVRRHYLDEWRFFCSVLGEGVYRQV